jgi:predicted amidohydrolase YtcJ
MIYCPSPTEYCGDSFPRISQAGDGRLDVHSVKLFGDGALGSRGAALLKDYSDQPGWRGFMLVPEEKWEGIVRMWYEKVSSKLADLVNNGTKS